MFISLSPGWCSPYPDPRATDCKRHIAVHLSRELSFVLLEMKPEAGQYDHRHRTWPADRRQLCQCYIQHLEPFRSLHCSSVLEPSWLGPLPCFLPSHEGITLVNTSVISRICSLAYAIINNGNDQLLLRLSFLPSLVLPSAIRIFFLTQFPRHSGSSSSSLLTRKPSWLSANYYTDAMGYFQSLPGFPTFRNRKHL